MRRGLALILAATALAGCSTDGGGGTDETKPTYRQAEGVAKRLLPKNDCTFKVDDKSSDDLEDKTLECLTKVAGQAQLFTVFHYTRDKKVDEADKYFGGLTTADRYFQNGNIKVDPAGQPSPGQPVLDATRFAQAVKAECDCGEVKTPEK